LDGIEEALGSRFRERLDRNLQDAVKTSGQKVEAAAAILASNSVYKGEYLSKLAAEFPTPYSVEVGSHAPHAPFLELDTMPHFPWDSKTDKNPMIEYAHLKLKLPYKHRSRRGEKETAESVGFLIAKKISKVGTKGQHIMLRAGLQSEEAINGIFLKAIAEAMR
jgi:hypothetical protein